MIGQIGPADQALVRYHNPCRHRTTYGMTCAEFDAMYAAAKGRCQICEIPEPKTSQGYLVIDHDNAISFHAVRGLLCPTCNVFLGRSGHLNPGLILRYVQRAWHLTHRNVQPVRIEVPDVPRDEVRVLLATASARCQDQAGRPLLGRAARQPLVDAIRIAAKAGFRTRFIRDAINNLWTRAQVEATLHVKGCKVAGPIRTRDDDLVKLAGERRAPGHYGQGFEFRCHHPGNAGPDARWCGAKVETEGTWPASQEAAEALGWTFPNDTSLCEAHAGHVDCADICVHVGEPSSFPAQLPLFAA